MPLTWVSLETWSAHRLTALTALFALPIIVPVGYVFYTSWTVYKNTTLVSGTLVPRQGAFASAASHPAEPHSLPAEVQDDRSQWVVTYERVVSNPLLPSSLAYPPEKPLSSGSTTEPSRLLQEVSRNMQKAFSRTPQAILLRSALSESLNKESFKTTWISNLTFRPGDIVNGVYKVSCNTRDQTTGSERVELVIDAPASYKGPRVRGLILTAIEPASSESSDDRRTRDEEKIVFVNETWMWRLADEKPTLLESSIGQWLHRLLAGWLLLKGISGVSGTKQGKSASEVSKKLD
ncbi:hypothetical protein ED733_007881 [Metarhizium rileyi]|uniref:Uncharacterized protein n=1 Tax=Metarhizium rileyi (strain RCEF 4871) TaxID=1649241 RepID=A0A5C6GF57_METRR|nr:hypothetical protein ED733_007881 [Metarhizium rileyi]